MASIRKTKAGRFEVQIRRKGFASVTKSFLTLADARKWARARELEADQQELSPSREVLKTITLKQLVERYRDTVTPRKKGAKTETIMLNAFLKHDICRKSLFELTKEDFSKYRDERLAEVKPASLRRQLMPVLGMLNLAQQEWGVPLKRNPLHGLKLDTGEDRRERRLRAGEFDKLVAAVRNDTNPYLLPIVKFALETAMRRSEILSLTWADVDIERHLVTIRQAKNGSGRVIPLSHAAVRALSDAKALQGGEPQLNALVFPVVAATLRFGWEGLLRRAKIDGLRFHDLRHEAISRLFELGLTVPEVAQISGHRTLGMLMRYAHANNTAVRAKLGIIEDTTRSIELA